MSGERGLYCRLRDNGVSTILVEKDANFTGTVTARARSTSTSSANRTSPLTMSQPKRIGGVGLVALRRHRRADMLGDRGSK
jgi:hypothetical protein